ncbi:MAG: hypothetical protein WED07_16665 [Candidatus Freyarchaeum deiterrae]
MGAEKKVEETLKVLNLKVLEQGMEKIAGAFDQYIEQMNREFAAMNQRMTDIECRLENLEKLSTSSSFGNEAALQILPASGTSSESSSSTSLTPIPPPRQPVKRRLEPASFLVKEDLNAGKPPREGFGGYRPARGSIDDEKHVKVSVFTRELDKRKQASSITPDGGRKVIIAHNLREDTTANEPIDLLKLTPRDLDPRNRREIEDWLCKTEGCFNDLELKTQEEVMINYTQLKSFLCKEKREKGSSCTGCLVQDTLVCPLCKL